MQFTESLIMFNKNTLKYSQIKINEFTFFLWCYQIFFNVSVKYCILYKILFIFSEKSSELNQKAV